MDLEHQIQVVAKTAPHFHSQCAEQAVHIKFLMISDGMPTLWITLNLSDLWSLLVLSYAGVQLDFDFTDTTAKRLQESIAVMNSVAVAQFFNNTCQRILNHLLQNDGFSNAGLFGSISTYFGIVEINGREILHFHCLIWLQKAHHIAKLRQNLQEKLQFRVKFFSFIDSIIKCSLHELENEFVQSKK